MEARKASRTLWDRTKSIAKRVVRYDDTEANRLGVPMVGVQDYMGKMVDHPWELSLIHI